MFLLTAPEAIVNANNLSPQMAGPQAAEEAGEVGAGGDMTSPEGVTPILHQPLPMQPVQAYCPPGLEPLLEAIQVVVHKGNFRKNIGTEEGEGWGWRVQEGGKWELGDGAHPSALKPGLTLL